MTINQLLSNKKISRVFFNIIVEPFFQTICAIIIGKIMILIWSLFDKSYHPDSITAKLTLLLSIITILMSSNLIKYALHMPMSYIFLVTLPVNASLFVFIWAAVLFTRTQYHRPDFLCYFISSSILLFLTSFIYEKNKKYIIFNLPSGKQINLINNRNIRIVGNKLNNKIDPRKINFTKFDGIVVDFSKEIPPIWQTFLAEAVSRGIFIYDSNELIENIDGYVPLDGFARIAMKWRIRYQFYEKVKFLLDILFSILVLPIFIFVIGICCLAIKIDTNGPVFFKQNRIGKSGKIFKIFKLRTMFHENMPKPIKNTTVNDPRITRVGKILRQTRLDEFPQIFNILKGEMSWIGPRPETVELSNLYKIDIPLYSYRNRVRPGITGWAAVNQGYVSGNEDTKNKLQYDMFYIENLSLTLDILIIFKTIHVILTRRGAL